MARSSLGKVFEDGEIIVRQGDEGNCMYVIQEGRVEVVRTQGDDIVRLAVLNQGDFFGEMAIFEKEVRSATVRALEQTRVLTVDKRTFLRRIQEDPTLAFRVVEAMSNRIKRLNEEFMARRREGRL
jgi:CRP-like cAMP-binding protein